MPTQPAATARATSGVPVLPRGDREHDAAAGRPCRRRSGRCRRARRGWRPGRPSREARRRRRRGCCRRRRTSSGSAGVVGLADRGDQRSASVVGLDQPARRPAEPQRCQRRERHRGGRPHRSSLRVDADGGPGLAEHLARPPHVAVRSTRTCGRVELLGRPGRSTSSSTPSSSSGTTTGRGEAHAVLDDRRRVAGPVGRRPGRRAPS